MCDCFVICCQIARLLSFLQRQIKQIQCTGLQSRHCSSVPAATPPTPRFLLNVLRTRIPLKVREAINYPPIQVYSAESYLKVVNYYFHDFSCFPRGQPRRCRGALNLVDDLCPHRAHRDRQEYTRLVALKPSVVCVRIRVLCPSLSLLGDHQASSGPNSRHTL